MNFVKFATKLKVTNNKLTKLSENVIPRFFPTYSSNPRGKNFALYCKYQLLRYKPWTKTQSDLWHGQVNPTDEVLINAWKEYLQTLSAQEQVPDWLDKLQFIVQSQQDNDDQPYDEHDNTREEWMVSSNLNSPFDNLVKIPVSANEWHYDRNHYSEQQISEMPTWIKTMREDYVINADYDIDINSFSEMQKLGYDIIKTHFQDVS